MKNDVTVNMDAVIEFQNQLNLSDSRLADLMGVSRTLVSRVKSRQRNPAGAFIQGLVKAGMKPEKIFLRK